MAGDRKFSIGVEVDASKATSGLASIKAEATKTSATIAALSKELKKLYTERDSSGRTASQDFLPDTKRLEAQARVIRDVSAAMKEFGEASRSLKGVDVAQSAKGMAKAFDQLGQSVKNIKVFDPKMLAQLKEQIKVMREAQSLANQVAGAANKSQDRANKQAAAAAREAARAAKEKQAAEEKAAAAAQKSAQAQAAAEAKQAAQAAANAKAQQAAQAQAAAQANRAYIASLTAEAVESRKAASAALSHTDALESVRFGAMQLRNTFAVLSAASVAAAATIISNAADQERAFVDVARTLERTPADLEGLRQQYQKLSTEVSTPFEELSRIGSLGAQMNIAKEDLGDFTTAVAGFATITGETVDSATESFGRLVSFFNQAKSIRPDYQVVDDGDQYERLASQVAELGAKSIATEGEILKMSESIATSTAAAGIGQNDTLAYAAALTSVGIRAEHARGSLQRIFAGFNKDAAEGAQGMEDYARAMGVTADEAYRLWTQDPNEFFTKLLKGIRDVGDGIDQTVLLSDLGFKNTRDVELIKRLANNYGVLEQAIRNSNEASKDSSFLQNSLDLVNSTLTETIARWKNSLANFMANFGEPFLGPLKALLNIATSIQNVLAGWAQTGAGKFIAGIAGGIATFVALKGVMGTLKVASLGVVSSYAQLQAGMVRAGTSGELTWGNIIRMTRSAAQEVSTYQAKVDAAAAAESRLAAAKRASAATPSGGVAVGGAGAATTAKVSSASSGVASAANAAAAGLSKTASQAAQAASQASVASRVFTGLQGVLGAVGLTSPWGWVALGLTLLPTLVAAFDGFDSAAKSAKQSAEESVERMGGVQTVWEAIQKDQQEIANGTQKAVSDARVPVDQYTFAVKASTDQMYWYTDASGKLVQATMEQADAFGYTSLKVGENLKKLQLNALVSSDAFKKSSEAIINSDFDFSRWVNASTQGRDAANAVVDEYVKTLEARRKEITVDRIAKSQSTGRVTDPVGEAEMQAIAQQIDAIKQLKDEDLGGVMSETAAQMQLTQQAASALGLSEEDLANSTGMTKSEAEEAAEAFQKFTQSLHDAVDGAFAMVNAEAGLFESTDALTDAIAKNGNTFDIASEQGRDNVKALQEYINSIVEYAAQSAQALGLTGAEAQRYVNEQVQSAIAELNAQGIDTSAIEQTIANIGNAFGQPMQGPSVDFSQLDSDLNGAVARTQSAANQIQTILNGVGGRSNSTQITPSGFGGVGGTFGGKGGFFGNLASAAKRLISGSGSRRSGGGLGSSSAASKQAATRSALDLGAILRKSMAGAPSRVATKSGGGGGSRSPKSGGRGGSGGGGGSKSSRREKTAEEIFEDFLNRLSSAMKTAIDKFWRMRDAQDSYQSALIAMRKRITDAKDKIQDLRDSIADLNSTLAEQQQKLHDAQYFHSIAVKYGDQERIKSTQTEVDTAQHDVDKTKKEIASKNQEVIDTSQNIAALTGFTEAAIANRAALKSVQQASLELISAYAEQGATTEQLSAYAQQLKNDFIEQAVQAGYDRGEVTTLAGAFDSLTATIGTVPRRVDEEVTDNGTISAVQSGIDGISGGSVPVSVVPDGLDNFREQVKWNALSGLNTAKDMSAAAWALVGAGYRSVRKMFRHDGGPIGFASGGRVPGRPPANPNEDNLLAMTQHGSLYGIRSGEYVINQKAVDFYGRGTMEAINSMQVPQVSTSGGENPGFVTINPSQIQALARAVSSVIALDGRAISENSNRQWAVQGSRGRY